MKSKSTEHANLLKQIEQIAQGLGETFAPFCEVVVHNLTQPEHAILSIHNNLSGREPGDPVTELGAQRIANSDFPQVIANYLNRFPDGRQVKSTSIGIRDSSGKFVAALCLNIDLTIFQSLQGVLNQFGSINMESGIKESLDPVGAQSIRNYIDQFAAQRAATPRTLKADERRALVGELKDNGFFEVRRAMETIAQHLGVSRGRR